VDVCLVSYRQFRVQDQSDMRIVILFCGNPELISLFFQSCQISRDQENNLFCSSQETSTIVIQGDESILNVLEGLTPD